MPSSTQTASPSAPDTPSDTSLETTPATAPHQDAASPAPDETIVVRGSDDLVAAVPHLIGFPPERSLVTVALRREDERSMLGVVARFDLPTATGTRTHQLEGSATESQQLVDQAVEILRRDGAQEVVALVYDEGPCSAKPPWQRLVDRLEKALRASGLVMLDALFVAGSRFRSYRCDDPLCCPAEGRQVDPLGNRVAAQLGERGRAPAASRAELRSVVRAADHDRCAAVEAVARRELCAISDHWAEDQSSTWRDWQQQSVRLMARIVNRYLAAAPALDDDEAGRVIAGLCDVPVRDAAAVLFTRWAEDWVAGADCDADDPPNVRQASRRTAQLVDSVRADPGPDTPEPGAVEQSVGTDRDLRLESFWIDLATRCDGPLAAPPLALLGMHVWSQGNGTLAAAAAERALEVDSGYRLALLLDQALSVGVRPRRLGEQPPPNGD